MIMTSGLNYGIRRSLPHYNGIVIGFPAMVMVIGLGLATLFDRYPVLHILLKLAGIIYLSYLAWKIASAPVSELNESGGKPFSFLQAAAFQWINPKAWILAVGAISTFTVVGQDYPLQVVKITLLFLIFGAPCILLWLWFGSVLKRLLQKPQWVRLFNLTMALLLVASLGPVFLNLYQQVNT